MFDCIGWKREIGLLSSERPLCTQSVELLQNVPMSASVTMRNPNFPAGWAIETRPFRLCVVWDRAL